MIKIKLLCGKTIIFCGKISTILWKTSSSIITLWKIPKSFPQVFHRNWQTQRWFLKTYRCFSTLSTISGWKREVGD